MSIAKRALRAFSITAAIAGPALLLAILSEKPGLAAVADNVYVNTNVNQRAGPGTNYPVITIVPARARVTVHGCLTDFSWCDVSYRGNRGWAFAKYLWAYDQGRYFAIREYGPRIRLALVTFALDRYWDAFYRSRPFYADRARFISPRPGGAINVGVFYDRLSPHGDWLWLRGNYVWVPANVDAGWRPYTAGHWAYTDRYGWMWVSAEPFGWATYHYGRWGFSKQVGWFWVPGTQWAPAWVAWRGSDDYLAWAPLPPAPDPSISVNINISFEAVPHYYWQVVPTTAFLSADLSQAIIRDDADFLPVLEATRPVGNVTIVNNVVVNNVVNVQQIEEKTNVKVVVHNVVRTDDPDKSGTVEKGAVEVFVPPAVEAAAAAPKPAEVKEVEAVAAASQTKEQAGDQPATEELVAPPPAKPSTAEAPATEPPPAAEQPPAEDVPAADAPAAEAPAAAEGQPAVEPEPPAEPPPPPTDEPAAPPVEEAAPADAPPPAQPPAEGVEPAAPAEPPPPPADEPAAPPAEAPAEAAPPEEPAAVESEPVAPAEPPPPPVDEPAAPPAAEAPAEPAPAEAPPDEAPAVAPEPAAPAEPPVAEEQAAPPVEEAPAEPAPPEAAPAEEQPAVEPEPAAPTEPAAPPADEPAAPPADAAPAETPAEPAPESAAPAPGEEPPPCPEGTVRQEDGTCVAPQ
jgi:uncharacterized protein YraI